jgi:hypothetical protein
MEKVNSEGSKIRRIISAPIAGAENPVSALTVENGEVRIVNPTEVTDSSGRQVPAGAGTILSAGDGDASINASYIKTGVLDANLLRTGQLQTIASWNNKNYGSVEDSIEAQQGYTGGYVYLTDWTTVSPNVVYAAFATWGDYLSGTTTGTTAAATYFSVGDYIRVTGANFGTPGDNTQADGENANVGVVDQEDGPVGYGQVVAVDTVGTGIFYTVDNTGKTELEEGKVARSQVFIPTISKAHKIISVTSSQLPAPNPAQIFEVIVTTSDEHYLVPGDYVELYNCGAVYSGVWYVVNCPEENVFTFRHRFGIEAAAALGGAELPSLETPVAIRVRKTYAVSANGDLTAASLNIQTARTQDGGDPIFQVLNDSVIIRKPDGTILLSANTVGSSIDIGTVTADEITVGGDIDPNQVVRVGTNVSPSFQGIWAGNANPDSAEFSVDLNGNLKATNANISGSITASSGSIATWTIDAESISSIDTGGEYSGLYHSDSDVARAFFAGASSNTGSGASFYVQNDGTLYAGNATIVGGLTADRGNIGGWTIGATELYSSEIYLNSGGRLQIGNSAEITNQDGVTTGNNVFYIDDEQGMWIGNADIEQAPFRVNLDGSIVANNATITDLSVDSLRMDGRIRFGTSNGQLQSFQVLTSDLSGVAAQWNQDGLQVSDGDITNSDRIYINGSQIQLLNADGATLNAITAEGINASTIKFGALPGGSNLIPNSSFEFAPFSLGANGTPNNTAGVGTTFNITETGNTTTGFTMVLSNYGY